ncbi:MAG: redoxin domain-containing protein [Chitinophagaceae bacterium]
MQLQPGQKAPPFSLYDTRKNKVSLEDFKGSPVILLFFPLAFTSVCTKELCSVRDNIATYNKAKATVLGISVDSLYTLAKFKEDQHLNFDLLSDFNKEVSANYDSLYDLFSYDMKGVSKRAAFVIDEEGMILHSEVLENAGEVPNFEAIISVLNSLYKEKLNL